MTSYSITCTYHDQNPAVVSRNPAIVSDSDRPSWTRGQNFKFLELYLAETNADHYTCVNYNLNLRKQSDLNLDNFEISFK